MAKRQFVPFILGILYRKPILLVFLSSSFFVAYFFSHRIKGNTIITTDAPFTGIICPRTKDKYTPRCTCIKKSISRFIIFTETVV